MLTVRVSKVKILKEFLKMLMYYNLSHVPAIAIGSSQAEILTERLFRIPSIPMLCW